MHRSQDGTNVSRPSPCSPKVSPVLATPNPLVAATNEITVIAVTNENKVDDTATKETNSRKVEQAKKKVSPKLLLEKTVQKLGKSKKKEVKDLDAVSSHTRQMLEPVAARLRNKKASSLRNKK